MEITQWIFFGPAKLAAIWPYAGLAIAIALILIQIAITISAGAPFDKSFFRKAPVFAGLLWLIFGFYEMQMQAVIFKSVTVPTFRLDLIVLTPILYLMSAAAVYVIWHAIWRALTHKNR